MDNGWCLVSEKPKEDGLYQVLKRNWMRCHPLFVGTVYDVSNELFMEIARFENGGWKGWDVFTVVAWNPQKLLESLKSMEELIGNK